MKITSPYIACILFFVICMSCNNTEDLIDFTEEDEILLGEKLATTIREDSSFSILTSENNSIAYGYVDSRLQEITSSGTLSKSEDFVWSITLFDDESRQAFATPGGFIYVSTGLIFYLSNEDEFSGVLAHLVAMVDQSYITEALFFEYGVNGLKSIASNGSAEQLNSIIELLDLRGSYLPFTRANELVADTLAVTLLSATDQSCGSNALFFDRCLNVQPELIADFTDAHSLDTTRVMNIENLVGTLGCNNTVDTESADRFRNFRNSLN